MVPTKIGRKIIEEKPKAPKTKLPQAYRGELLPPSVRKATVDFVRQLKKHKVKYMVVGAVPVQFYGRERFSRDVDVVLFLNDRTAKFLFEMVKGGRYKVRYPFPHEHRLEKPEGLLNWHLLRLVDLEYDSLLDVHLKPGEIGLDDSSLARAKNVTLNGGKVVIPSPEDYLVTKLISRRPGSHDFEDIMSTLISQYRAIDWKYLEAKAEKHGVLFLLKFYKDAIEKKLLRKKQ